MAPIAVLLYLNWKGYIIGAAAWCPRGQCYPRVFDRRSAIPQILMAEFDRENHNLLGALQLVAKALEVWFMLIASWLVYMITMFMAGTEYGLPIAYLTRPNEFSDAASLLDSLLWSTLPNPFRRTRRKVRLRIWAFILLTILLCAICNLMGPAVAVLVIPTLQWIKTADYSSGVFTSYNAYTPNTLNYYLSRITWCTKEDLANGL